MKKFITMLLMILMVWVVVDKQCTHSRNYFVLENKIGVRKVFHSHASKDNEVIIGDRVKIKIPTKRLKWYEDSYKYLEGVI